MLRIFKVLNFLCNVYQVDVLESQFSQLLHQINSTRDFESIRLAHDHFLSNLLAQSFILLKPVSKAHWFPRTASSTDHSLRHFELTGYETIIKQLFKSILKHFLRMYKAAGHGGLCL